MSEDRLNEPDSTEAPAIDPPSNAGGGNMASQQSSEAPEPAAAIDPPSNAGGGS